MFNYWIVSWCFISCSFVLEQCSVRLWLLVMAFHDLFNSLNLALRWEILQRSFWSWRFCNICPAYLQKLKAFDASTKVSIHLFTELFWQYLCGSWFFLLFAFFIFYLIKLVKWVWDWGLFVSSWVHHVVIGEIDSHLKSTNVFFFFLFILMNDSFVASSNYRFF